MLTHQLFSFRAPLIAILWDDISNLILFLLIHKFNLYHVVGSSNNLIFYSAMKPIKLDLGHP